MIEFQCEHLSSAPIDAVLTNRDLPACRTTLGGLCKSLLQSYPANKRLPWHTAGMFGRIPGGDSLVTKVANPILSDIDLPQVQTIDTRRRIAQLTPQPRKSGLSFLAAEELPRWDALVETSPQCSLFCKSWWLKAACGEAQVLGYFESGQLVAGIPLHYSRHMGLRICCMPKHTQTLGVVIAPIEGKQVTVQSRETEILDIFAARLAQETVFVQAFHPACQNWLPFYWRGFTQTTHYTYVLDNLESTGRLWDGLAQVRRTNIRKAQKWNVRVKECSPETVYNASMQTFDRQKRNCPYSLDYFCRLYDAARANDAGICMAAEDGQGRVHAASFFVWDRNRGYYLVGGHHPDLATSGGHVLLMWNLIEFASTHTEVFDFEGSMHRPIEASFRSFGSKRVPYNLIAKFPRWLRIALSATRTTLL
jgi:CelD/BcsL family acetyltransferase involved in cellulose biosynthesis